MKPYHDKAPNLSPRELTFRIMRYNQHLPEDEPRIQEYQIQETSGMTIFSP